MYNFNKILKMIVINLFILISLVQFSNAWDTEQLEVFDVVDEVKENFYNLLNISKDASNQQIKSAFRSLSLKLHPDKNQDVDTSEQFRNLVSVYEVLKSSVKRKYYDEVLVNGLPNWKSAMYYYRYVRKMGITEVCIILFVIITIGQYLVHWATYWEMKLTLDQNQPRKKPKKGKEKNSEKIEEIIIPKPSLKNTLPVQIPKLIWHLIVTLPQTVMSVKTQVAQQIEEATKPKPIIEPEPEPVPKVKTVRKRNKFVVPEGANFETTTNNSNKSDTASISAPPPMSGGLWTDDDLSELVRLVKKYPMGTTGRWELISESLGRSVPEVTFMAHKMKDNAYKVPSEHEEEQPFAPKVKLKTKKELSGTEDVKNWSQAQQKSLEDALAKYTKRSADRWDKISELVPGKNKEDCMLRCRFIAENLKKQKESEQEIQSEDNIEVNE